MRSPRQSPQDAPRLAERQEIWRQAADIAQDDLVAIEQEEGRPVMRDIDLVIEIGVECCAVRSHRPQVGGMESQPCHV